MDFSQINFVKPKTRAVSISGHRTSFTLEDYFWENLKKMAQRENIALSVLVKKIDDARTAFYKQNKTTTGLSTAIRLVVCDWLSKQ